MMNWLTEPVVVREESKDNTCILGDIRPGSVIDMAKYDSNREAYLYYINALSKPLVKYEGSDPADLVLLKGN